MDSAEQGGEPQNPQGRTASTIRETTSLITSVGRMGPQQLNGLAFSVLVISVVGFLGWRIYSDDKAKAVETQANVDRQAQLLRFMETETEKGRQVTSQSVKECQTFFAGETDKQRKYYSDQERIRTTEGKHHMDEAFKNMADQTRKIESLGASIDKLSTAVNAFSKKTEQFNEQK
jgi:hypothetical protein